MAQVKITLSKSEFDAAAQVGLARQLQSMKPMENDHTSVERDPRMHWNNSIIGSAAESAVAKYLNVYWGSGVNTFLDSDIVGIPCEVRCSPSTIRKPKVRERDTRIIIAVINSMDYQREFTIWGWIEAQFAKQDKWKSKSEPICWFVPEHQWNDIKLLKEEMENL